MSIRNLKTIDERRSFIAKYKKITLDSVKIYPPEFKKAQFKSCENMIGATQIPLGVAGPVVINGNYARGEFYIPLATTEAALVASVNRGCKAITQSDSATVVVEDVGATRGPVFKTAGIQESLKFKKWLQENLIDIKKIASKTSKHLTLKKLDARIVGRSVYVRFYFDTDEAMGMNMATFATDSINRFIGDKTGINCLSVAGNFDTDKKPAWLNFILGRGKKVWAEVIIPKDVIAKTLKTTAKNIYKIWESKCMIGSIMSGSMGFNAHFANVIAAMFIACGQDVGHTVEGSLGITTTEIINDDLYISIYLPDLMVGTVGGGTYLPSQKEALLIMDINGAKNSSFKLAEIVGTAVLAGEISLLASLAEGSLASTHKRLARKD